MCPTTLSPSVSATETLADVTRCTTARTSGGVSSSLDRNCRRPVLRSFSCDPAPYLRLASRPLPAPGRPARLLRRPSSTRWSRSCAARRSTPCSSPVTCTTGRSRPLDAVQLCEDALVRLASAGASVVVDQRQPRFGDPAGLRLRAGGRLRGPPAYDPAQVAEPVLLEDRRGPVGIYAAALPRAGGGSDGACLPIRTVRRRRSAGAMRGVLQRAMDCVQADRAARRLTRAVVMAHAWVAGGACSESERDISVGGVGQVPAAAVRRGRLRRARPPARPADR